MIVQCAQCGTKYNLDDAKVRPGETKVKCSRCQYVFTAPRPLTLDEENIGGKAQEKDEDPFLQQWAKDFAPQSPPETRQPATPPPQVAATPPRAFIPPTEEEGQLEEEPLFGEASGPEEEMPPFKARTFEETPAKKGRAISTAFLLAVFLLVIIIGSLYFWSKEGTSIPAFEYIYEKIYTLMEGEKAQKLFVLNRRGTEYLLEGGKVYVIQGKVSNRSQETKRFVKLKSTLFDKAGKAVATSIGYCGITISNEEIKKSTYEGLKTSFGFVGASQAVPVPTQNSIPFTIIFFSPPDGATDYNVEIARDSGV